MIKLFIEENIFDTLKTKFSKSNFTKIEKLIVNPLMCISKFYFYTEITLKEAKEFISQNINKEILNIEEIKVSKLGIFINNQLVK